MKTGIVVEEETTVGGFSAGVGDSRAAEVWGSACREREGRGVGGRNHVRRQEGKGGECQTGGNTGKGKGGVG